jgi:hypothetical protein
MIHKINGQFICTLVEENKNRMEQYMSIKKIHIHDTIFYEYNYVQ